MLKAISRLALRAAPVRMSVAAVAPFSYPLARLYNSVAPEPIVFPAPRVRVRGLASDFSCKAVIDGEIKPKFTLSDYKGKWVVLFFYPKDFTFVCPTEIIAFSDRVSEFKALNCEVVGASIDTPEVHLAWVRTPRKKGGLGLMQIPLVSDVSHTISNDYGVLTPDGIALRGLFIIDPAGTVQQITINNFPVGRSVDETLRLVQAFQFNAKHGEVCPAGWTPGEPTMVDHPDKSLDYFRGVREAGASDDVTPLGKMSAASSPADVAAAVAKGPTVLFHSAGWCGKCSMIAPFVADLSEKYPTVKFVKVDTADNAFTKYKLDQAIVALPEFRFFSKGEEVGTRITGYKKGPLEAAVKSL